MPFQSSGAALTGLFLTFSFQVFSAEYPKGPTPEQEKMMSQLNERAAILNRNQPQMVREPDVTPYAEYNEAGYLILSADFNFNSSHVKTEVIRNLPETVTAVVFTGRDSPSEKSRLKERFKDVIPEERLKIIYLPLGGNGFWARDGIPVPTIKNDSQNLRVVDARYYHRFEADQMVADLFKSDLVKHDYYFEGGNFVANHLGDCLIVNKTATQKIPDSIFTEKYGCKTLLRLPHIKGIGHADESVKFINDRLVLTDAPEYVPLLEERGFQVMVLPRPRNHYETYVNSLTIGNTVFVPVFDQSTDQKAIEIYQSLGLRVVDLNTETLSNRGQGSIHCITMTYPPGPYAEFLKMIGGKEL